MTIPDPDCRNCDGNGCMDCRTRTVHDECVNDCPTCCPSVPDTPAVTSAPVPLFARAAQRPRAPLDFSYRSLGEVFADLLYQVNNGEDIQLRLADLAKATANDPVPRSIADNEDEEPACAAPDTALEAIHVWANLDEGGRELVQDDVPELADALDRLAGAVPDTGHPTAAPLESVEHVGWVCESMGMEETTSDYPSPLAPRERVWEGVHATVKAGDGGDILEVRVLGPGTGWQCVVRYRQPEAILRAALLASGEGTGGVPDTGHRAAEARQIANELDNLAGYVARSVGVSAGELHDLAARVRALPAASASPSGDTLNRPEETR